MKKVLFAVLSVIVCACHEPSQKVTYYEQHDNCQEMKILDSAMSIDKYVYKGDDDYDLAAALKLHHECSVELAQYEMEHAKNAVMKQIASAILENDKHELLVIDSFLNNYKPVSTISGNYAEVKRTIDKMQHTADLQLIKDNNDYDFAILILPQRQCGIDLADMIVHNCQSPFLKQLAETIDQNETVEIETLQQWLLKNKLR